MSSAAEPRRRLESIDVLRGVIMIVMALDHTRDYFGHPGDNPTNLATASAARFATLGLAALHRGTPALLRPTLVIGKVPLLYYMVHFCLIHLVAVAVCGALNGGVHWMFESPDLGHYPFPPPPVWGSRCPSSTSCGPAS